MILTNERHGQNTQHSTLTQWPHWSHSNMGRGSNIFLLVFIYLCTASLSSKKYVKWLCQKYYHISSRNLFFYFFYPFFKRYCLGVALPFHSRPLYTHEHDPCRHRRTLHMSVTQLHVASHATFHVYVMA